MHLRTILIQSLCVLALCAVAPDSSRSWAAGAQKSKIQPTTDLKDVDAVLKEDPSARTLLVLDIDDTLLTSEEFFGSDAWYEWQKNLPAGDPNLVNCKFDIIAMNYESGVQKATQPDGAAFINALTVDKILLTSRSLTARASTIRELQEANYDLPAPLSPKLDGIFFFATPGDPTTPTITYHRGLYMGAGQDKGKLLVRLLKMDGLKYARVILIDDGIKNIESMRVAMEAEGITYRGLYYTAIDKHVSPDRVRLAQQGWLEWQHLLGTTFPGRLARLKANVCAY